MVWGRREGWKGVGCYRSATPAGQATANLGQGFGAMLCCLYFLLFLLLACTEHQDAGVLSFVNISVPQNKEPVLWMQLNPTITVRASGSDAPVHGNDHK